MVSLRLDVRKPGDSSRFGQLVGRKRPGQTDRLLDRANDRADPPQPLNRPPYTVYLRQRRSAGPTRLEDQWASARVY